MRARSVRGAVALASIALAAAGPCRASAQMPAPLPEQIEIELAASALPAHLRDGATLYRFEPGKGLVVAREGSNGFHAFVSRVEPAIFRADRPYTTHPTDVLLPIAFDAAGPDGPMRPFVDAAELLARGATPEETARVMRSHWAGDRYAPASRSGVAFMLAPVLRAYPDPLGSDERRTLSVPHRMYYAPWVTNADIGGNPAAGTQPFVIQSGIHGYIGQRAGPDEARAVRDEHALLVQRLCDLEPSWCLSVR